MSFACGETSQPEERMKVHLILHADTYSDSLHGCTSNLRMLVRKVEDACQDTELRAEEYTHQPC